MWGTLGQWQERADLQFCAYSQSLTPDQQAALTPLRSIASFPLVWKNRVGGILNLDSESRVRSPLLSGE